MKIRMKIGDACKANAKAASGGKLTDDEIEAAFQRVAEYKQKLQASGDTVGMADKLRAFAEREAERTKIAAAMQKRHAALNILVRDRLDTAIDGFIKAGMTPKKAMLAVLEGTQKGIEGGRNSVAALNGAYEARYLGAMFAEIQANRPHLVHALRDAKMDADILREMSELREGGKPGITGNDDARYAAKVFASYAELSRTDLNSLGASIGKLEGWAGAQTHDDIKMIAAGKDSWVSRVLPRLDLDRTFPDMTDMAEVRETLGDVYDTIITGVSNKVSAKEKGQRVNPANLAKRLGKSRVLHFKDADAMLAYRDEFGHGNTVSGIVAHLRNSARMAANMDALGPNPEVMFASIAEKMKKTIKESATLTDIEKAKQIRQLDTDAGALRQAIDIATGLSSRPVNVTGAKISADIRAWQSMAKLGGAVLSSVTDTITPAIAAQFRGSSFFKAWAAQLDGLRRGRPKGQLAEISFLLGEGFDGIIGHIVSPNAAVDGPVGRVAALQERFFRWNGLSWWTDIQRASAGRMIAAEMGMRAKTAFDQLPDNYRHVLGLHNIDATKWEIIRKAEFREAEGRAYVTPDRIRALPDEAFAPLVANRLDNKPVAPVKPGYVRFYHGGAGDLGDVSSLNDLWVTPQFEYARDYRKGATDNNVWFVDIPEAETVGLGIKDDINNYYINGKLPAKWAQKVAPFKVEGKTSGARDAAIIDRARRDLELNVLSFFADETSYGVVEVDPRTRRTMTQGLRPGTVAGEAIRFVTQFKGFPAAFTQRVGGRAIFGHRKGAGMLERSAHIGTLIASMTMAGYAAMTLKDMAKGYWPPRDPTDPKTWASAFIQGGAAGIYGDFLFSRVNRFGGGLTETAIGPSAGAIFDLAELGLKARDAALSADEKVKLADFLAFGTQNTPFINLFYTRPALDFLFLNSMREVATPGYTRKVMKRRKTEYGQESFMPAPLKTFGR